MDSSRCSYLTEECEYRDRKRARLQSSWLRPTEGAHHIGGSRANVGEAKQCGNDSRTAAVGSQLEAVPDTPCWNGQSQEPLYCGSQQEAVPDTPSLNGQCSPLHSANSLTNSSRTPESQLCGPQLPDPQLPLATSSSQLSHSGSTGRLTTDCCDEDVGSEYIEVKQSSARSLQPQQSRDEEDCSIVARHGQHYKTSAVAEEENESSQDSTSDLPALGKFETDLIRQIAAAHAEDILSIRSGLLRNQSEKKSKVALMTGEHAAEPIRPAHKLDVANDVASPAESDGLQSAPSDQCQTNDMVMNQARPTDAASARLTRSRQIHSPNHKAVFKIRKPKTTEDLGCTALPEPARLSPKEGRRSRPGGLRQRRRKPSKSDVSREGVAATASDDTPDQTEARSSADDTPDRTEARSSADDTPDRTEARSSAEEKPDEAEARSSADEVQDIPSGGATMQCASRLPGETAYLCPVCSKSFSTLPKLSEHLSEHPPEKGYKCKVCATWFGELSDLEGHCRLHTGKVQTNKPPARKVPFGSKPYPCTLCERRFHRQDSLLEHVRKHTGEKPHVCTICHKHFARKSDCTKHTKTHLPITSRGQGSEEMIWDASYGPRVYRPRKHIRGTPYDCQYCDKTFTQKGHLDRHTQVHTGEKPFVCTWCQRTFAQKGHLQRHEITHTGIKNFKCMMCDKWFAQGSDLTRHSRTHTGERPYVCTVCDKAFSQAGDLARHMGTHKKKKPFQCLVCEELFVSHKFLLKHLESHGPEALQHAEQMQTLMGDQGSQKTSGKPVISTKVKLGTFMQASGMSESDGDNSQSVVCTDSDSRPADSK